MVLHMLRRLIGDEAFFAGIRNFYAEWQYRKAGTSDLMQVMEKVSGRDLSRFFEAWIFREAVPAVKFTYRADAAKVVLRVEQRGVTAPLPITVRLQYRSGKTEHVLVQADGSVTEHTVQLAEPLRSATANADHGALAVMVR
jgi:aminopeptidase N